MQIRVSMHTLLQLHILAGGLAIITGGTALAVSTDDTEDLAVADLISSEDGVRTYLYTKFELVTIRGA